MDMRFSPYTRAAALVIGLMSAHSSLADVLCDADAAFYRSGFSAHKACIAEQLPEFADYSNFLSECTLRIYLTDLAERETLESGLLPAYKRHVEVLPWCHEQDQPVIEFEKARYGYQQMSTWKAAVEATLQDLEPASIVSVTLCDAKLHLSAPGDAKKRAYIGKLKDVGIPDAAYVLETDALKSRGAPVIGLPAVDGAHGDQVTLPVSFGTGVTGGELIIRRTSLHDAMRILPPCPGHGPQELPQSDARPNQPAATADELTAAAERITYAYIPAEASVRLAFDARQRLAALTYRVDDDQEGLAELIEGISKVIPLRRIYADHRIVFFANDGGSVFTTLVAERDWYDEPYRIGVSYAYAPGSAVTE